MPHPTMVRRKSRKRRKNRRAEPRYVEQAADLLLGKPRKGRKRRQHPADLLLSVKPRKRKRQRRSAAKLAKLASALSPPFRDVWAAKGGRPSGVRRPALARQAPLKFTSNGSGPRCCPSGREKHAMEPRALGVGSRRGNKEAPSRSSGRLG